MPLGGISTGTFELRADGKFHEWTIFNQYPAGNAKIQVMEDTFMGVYAKRRSEEADGGGQRGDGEEGVALVLQTHPPQDSKLPAVQTLQYQGAYPVSKLKAMDTRLPVDVAVYAYSSYQYNKMNESALPAVAFTVVMENPTDENMTASFMMNLPIGVIPNMKSVHEPMKPPTSAPSSERQERSGAGSSPSAQSKRFSFEDDVDSLEAMISCFDASVKEDIYHTWTYNLQDKSCQLGSGYDLWVFDENYRTGMEGLWNISDNCITFDRASRAINSSLSGNVSLCGFSSDKDVRLSFSTAASGSDIWKSFAINGSLDGKKGGNVPNGAVSASVNLGPKEKKEVTLVLSWYYPHREFLGLPVGNYYSNLFNDSIDAGKSMGRDLETIVSDISKLHSPFLKSSLPDYLGDVLINSLSHIRSAFWIKDSRWRQWEAYDCADIDSVHNDGERHIPYITIFPNSTIGKMYAWAGTRQDNGMIIEGLRCGCESLPLSPQKIDVGCGRAMSDVSSMFVVYLLELQQWYQDESTKKVVEDLWPIAKNATLWFIDYTNGTLPAYITPTYDTLGLNAYTYATYNGAFFLLAMRAAEELANYMGDYELAVYCQKNFKLAQDALDEYLWNETAQYYNAYYVDYPSDFDYKGWLRETGIKICEFEKEEFSDDEENMSGRARLFRKKPGSDVCVDSMPATKGALMTDSFYAQVLAYSLGLGTLVKNETRLRMHTRAVLDKNDTPYGFLVMTGRYPYPGNKSHLDGTDNSIWMMGNPNWATVATHLGEDPELGLLVAKKTMDNVRSNINDQWNVPGILGGIGYELDGLPYFTSHYGFYMSAWHMVMALSGQKANMTAKSLVFEPKVGLPYVLPVILPGAWGQLEAMTDTPTPSSNENKHTNTTYTVSLNFGSLNLEHLQVGKCRYSHEGTHAVKLSSEKSAVWSC